MQFIYSRQAFCRCKPKVSIDCPRNLRITTAIFSLTLRPNTSNFFGETDSIVTDSTVTDSIVTDSTVTDGIVTDSIVTDSIVTDNTVTDSTVTDSIVTDSTVTDSIVTDSIVTRGIFEQNKTCPAPRPVTTGEIVQLFHWQLNKGTKHRRMQ